MGTCVVYSFTEKMLHPNMTALVPTVLIDEWQFLCCFPSLADSLPVTARGTSFWYLPQCNGGNLHLCQWGLGSAPSERERGGRGRERERARKRGRGKEEEGKREGGRERGKEGDAQLGGDNLPERPIVVSDNKFSDFTINTTTLWNISLQ